MLQPEDEAQAETTWTNVPSATIREIRVKRVGFITVSAWWNRFEVETDQKTLKFRVPDRDLPHVVEALREIAGDRFLEVPSRRLSAGEFAMIGLAFLGLCAAITRLILGPREDRAFGIILLLFPAVAFPLACLREKRRSEYQPPRPPRKRRRRASGRRPFRSPILGWSLKAVGLGYILYILFSGNFSRAVDQKSTNSGLSTLLCLPGIAALVLGSRLCIRTFEPRHHPDPRRPVLFLRAFDDDGKRTFQPTSWLAFFHGVCRYRDRVLSFVHPTKILKTFLNAETFTAEELLASGFRRCGPFVAIGRPGERLATSGPDLMYVPDADWQKVVLDYLEISQAVVLQPAKTDGVQWEIEQVFARVPRHRVLLSMLNFKDRPNLYEEFRAWIAREHGIHLAIALPFQETPSLVYFEVDGSPRCQPVCYFSPVGWTFLGNAVDNEKTFYTFIQGLDGEPREEPCIPNRHVGHALPSILMIGCLWFGLIAWWAWVGEQTRRQLAVAREKVGEPPRFEVEVAPRIAVEHLTHGGAPPAPADSPKVAEQIPALVARSPRITLWGRAFPYRLDVPEAMIKRSPNSDLMEHWLKSPDGRLNVQVVTNREPEDLSTLAQRRLEANSVDGVAEAKLEAVRANVWEDLDSIEAVIRVSAKNGLTVTEKFRAASDHRGTLLVMTHMVGSPQTDPIYSQVVQEILDSIRFVKPSPLSAESKGAVAETAPNSDPPVAGRAPDRPGRRGLRPSDGPEGPLVECPESSRPLHAGTGEGPNPGWWHQDRPRGR